MGKKCEEMKIETEICVVPPCPIHGTWSLWHSWGSCSKTCGTGSRTSTRLCDNPKPQNGGSNCIGGSVKQESCNKNQCPSKYQKI